MKKVRIEGHAKSSSRCMECGRKLTIDEYNTCTDMCKVCFSRAGGKKYIDPEGNNRISSILANKFRRR